MRVLAITPVLATAMMLLTLPGAGAAKGVSLHELMTPEQFKDAGLSKLTPAEIAALESWLGTYTEAVATVVRAKQAQVTAGAAPRSSVGLPSSNAIESCIDGDFNGWEGETIFKLCNGQIWQQSEYAYTYEYAYRPDVVIYKTSSGYRMKVQDVEETIGVTRIK